MSTVEGYDLHVYCDEPECDEGTSMRPFGPAFGEFAGEARSHAYRMARKAGWVINTNKKGKLHGGFHARCPKHA